MGFQTLLCLRITSVQFSFAQLCPTLCNPMDDSTPGLPVQHQLPEFTQTLSWWCLLLLPSILPSIRVFSNNSIRCIRWPQYRSFSFNINPSNEYSGLISFRIDWLDLLAVEGTQESSPTPQFKSINSWTLSLLYDPTLTSVHDYWKNHSFEYTELAKLCLYFLKCCLGLS